MKPDEMTALSNVSQSCIKFRNSASVGGASGGLSICHRLVRHEGDGGIGSPRFELGWRPSMRFLSMIRADETAGQGPSEQLMADMGELIDELTRSGQLVSTAGLRPSAEGV